jgi:hypothetical protein
MANYDIRLCRNPGTMGAGIYEQAGLSRRCTMHRYRMRNDRRDKLGSIDRNLVWL